MTARVHITGASGTGVSSLGQALAQQLHVSLADVDEARWAPADPPHSRKNPIKMRRELLREKMGTGGWVVAGSLIGWGEALVQEADLIVFLTVPTPIRIDRLRRRERQRFGRRILEGGDMCAIHEDFISWAARYDDPDYAGLNIARHESWLAVQKVPVLTLQGTLPVARLVRRVLAHKVLRRSYA